MVCKVFTKFSMLAAGESLARLSIFVIFTAVMQRFKFELIPGQPKPTIEPIDGLTVAPHPFSAKVSLRS